MKKWSILFLILFGCMINPIGINAQNIDFKIDGTINVDSGKIYLHFYSDYLPDKTSKITAEIKNRRFTLSGVIPESQGVFISVDNNYVSADFVIDPGVQNISINIDAPREVPVGENRTMLEEYPDYIAFYKEINAKKELFYQKIDSLHKFYNNNLPESISLMLSEEQKALYSASDSTLLKYAETNPNSKIAFWNLIRLIN
ncbi:MAG: DUF4369 domain-containing protein [Tannerellaceae bacterium]|nr:DUF4369 domain-containing protein [Tannerellaceae bacterium]